MLLGSLAGFSLIYLAFAAPTPAFCAQKDADDGAAESLFSKQGVALLEYTRPKPQMTCTPQDDTASQKASLNMILGNSTVSQSYIVPNDKTQGSETKTTVENTTTTVQTSVEPASPALKTTPKVAPKKTAPPDRKVGSAHLGKPARILAGYRVVDGQKVCAKKNDRPHKSDHNPPGQIDAECCLDPDEIPNSNCYYPPAKYGNILERYLNQQNK